MADHQSRKTIIPVSKESDVSKLKDSISIELKKNHYCIVRAAGQEAVYKAIAAITEADKKPIAAIFKEVDTSTNPALDVMVFSLALLDGKSSVTADA